MTSPRVLFLLLCISMAGVSAQPFNYPVSRKSSDADLYHGTEVKDPYRWLEDDYSEETREWVKAQNNLTD